MSPFKACQFAVERYQERYQDPSAIFPGQAFFPGLICSVHILSDKTGVSSIGWWHKASVRAGNIINADWRVSGVAQGQ
jgi:hypothetical protein